MNSFLNWVGAGGRKERLRNAVVSVWFLLHLVKRKIKDCYSLKAGFAEGQAFVLATDIDIINSKVK